MKRIIEWLRSLFKRKPKYTRQDVINIGIESYRLSKHHGARWIGTKEFIKWIDEQIIKLNKS